jgi:hypothetical protein
VLSNITLQNGNVGLQIYADGSFPQNMYPLEPCLL